MMYNGNKKTILFILSFVIAIVSLAQNGDEPFRKGKSLQKTMQIKAQNNAIKQFKLALSIYSTPHNQKKCKDEISVCEKNITGIEYYNKGYSLYNNAKKTKEKKKRTQTANDAIGRLELAKGCFEDRSFIKKCDDVIIVCKKLTGSDPIPDHTPNLEVSPENVRFEGGSPGSIQINVKASSTNWTYNIPEGISGESNFVDVLRSTDSKSLQISTSSNPSTIERTQTISVVLGSTTKRIKITQDGKPVELSTSSSLIMSKPKGGKQKIVLYTNSDSAIPTNNDLPWAVESKPGWIEVCMDEKKSKTVGDVDTKVYNLLIVFSPLPKSDPLYETGRKSEIVFVSQNKKCMVSVFQQK